MADREETSTTRALRPAAPVFDGPLASSGAAPDPAFDPPPAIVPRPRAEAEPGRKAEPAPRAEPGPKVEPGPAAPTEPALESAAGPSAMTGTAPSEPVPQTPPGPEPTSPTPTPTPTEQTKPAAKPDVAVIDLDVPPTERPGVNRRIRIPFAHAIRRWPSPGEAAGAVRTWSRRPSGRLTLPALLLFALVATTGAVGALLLPATARAPGAATTGAETSTPTPEPTVPGFPIGPGGFPSGLPGTPSLGAPSVPAPPWNMTGGRPSDVLAAWAAQIGTRVGVSATAMQAYGYAELQLSQTTPSCGLRWTTLAAIGHVESGHGRANGAVLGPNGISSPEIIGLPLDGNGGRMRIMDTEDGRLDRDATYDRAVGPMQFIPTTWEQYGADADGDGVENPHSLDDAALAAGNYLCKGGRNLSIASDWWGAILSYNDVRPYAQSVFDAANRYGTESRT